MKIQPFNCPACGAMVRVQGPKAKVATCFQCGGLIDLVSEEKKLLGQAGSRPAPRSSIALGKKATFEGVPSQVIGRVRFQMEGGGGEDYWDEWALISQQGEYLWLSEDEDGFTLQKAFVPLHPLDPTGLPPGVTSITLEKEAAQIEEQGVALVAYVEGELPWRAALGKRTGYLDALAGKTAYSIEWSPEEIEFYKGQELDPQEVYKALGLKEAPAAWKAPAPVSHAHKAVVWALVGFGLFCLVTSIVLSTTGSLMESKKFTLKEVDNEPGIMGPLELKETGGVYRVDMAASGLDQSVNSLDIIILDEANQPLHHIEGDFWDEVGYDDEGRWHESDTSHSAYFRLVRPGKYTFVVMGEGDAKAQNTGFEVKLYEGVWPSWWTLWAGIIGLIYPVGFVLYRLKQKGGKGNGGNGDDD